MVAQTSTGTFLVHQYCSIWFNLLSWMCKNYPKLNHTSTYFLKCVFPLSNSLVINSSLRTTSCMLYFIFQSSNSLSKPRGGATSISPSKPVPSRSREKAPVSSPSRPSQGSLKPSLLKNSTAKTSSQTGKPRSPKGGVAGSSSRKKKPTVGSWSIW